MKKYLIPIFAIVFLSNCASQKQIDKNEIKTIFDSNLYVMISVGDSNNNYHPKLHMFKDDSGTPFFPVFTSRDKILETEMVMPDSFACNGIILALTSHDEVNYKINYSLDDEIVITGKQLKKLLRNEIEEFKKNNSEILKNVILNN
ncbi:SseB family protein [Aquimarina sp. I32.4]|uniref:SseB family protein n=1 Tax=Aquimarina sp. I32.4 TaxID=2053903 RepID=UPI000CDEF806|nr:SseB family protein [Aquimarina sp. I32.4]